VTGANAMPVTLYVVVMDESGVTNEIRSMDGARLGSVRTAAGQPRFVQGPEVVADED
jgi:uncharacterized protein GlcG (DUF336 family)